MANPSTLQNPCGGLLDSIAGSPRGAMSTLIAVLCHGIRRPCSGSTPVALTSFSSRWATRQPYSLSTHPIGIGGCPRRAFHHRGLSLRGRSTMDRDTAEQQRGREQECEEILQCGYPFHPFSLPHFGGYRSKRGGPHGLAEVGRTVPSRSGGQHRAACNVFLSPGEC